MQRPLSCIGLAAWLGAIGCRGKADAPASGDEGEAEGETGEALDSDTSDSGEGAPADLALIADTSNGRYLFVRLDDGTVVHELRLSTLDPKLCSSETCAAFVAWPSIDAAGGDQVTLSFSPNTPDEPAAAVIARVRLGASGDEEMWRLSALDFYTNFSDRPDICAQTAPCEVPDSEDPEVRRRCRLALSHEVKVAEETESGVVLWIADTEQPARVLKVALNTASACGVVEDVISEETAPDWNAYQAINDVDLVETGEDTPEILFNSLSHDKENGLASTSLWRREESGWSRVWQHPSVESGAYLGAAHNPDIFTDDDGQTYLVYAHSNGLGVHPLVDSFTGELDHHGTIGVARVSGDGVEYLFDAAMPGELGFLRDVNRLDDGTFLVTDSGCMHPDDTDCTNPGQLWNIELPPLSEASATGLSGGFTAPHEQMNIVLAHTVDGRFGQPLTCGLWTPYSAQFMPAETLGRTLRAMLATGGSACPAE